MNSLVIGCVADDFTGASDAASFFLSGGLKTLLVNGIPQNTDFIPVGIQVVVIALKSRTQRSELAVADSKRAFEFLKNSGCKQLYFKYCSTFDSTREGNIGPVIDAVLEEYQLPYTVICPALPVNKRTVKNGHLFVDGVPLHKSSMKDHPITPMWDSDLSSLMSDQGKYKSMKLTEKNLLKSKEEIQKIIDDFSISNNKNPFYIIPDYFEEKHAEIIADLFRDSLFLTGGSGLPYSMAKLLSDNNSDKKTISENNINSGQTLLLAGSCSTATRSQIQTFKDNGGISMEIDLDKLLKKEIDSNYYSDFILKNSDSHVLLYTPEKTEKTTDPYIFILLEETIAEVSADAVLNGVKKIIVAGGETSGAVAKALKINAYLIAESVAPGVPVLIPVEKPDLRLVYKSGNFGQVDFFMKAISSTEKASIDQP